MAKASITKRTVDAAKPGKSDFIIWDDALKGFGLKVTPAGRKVYLYQYRLARPGQAAATAPRKYTIGTHGDLTPEQARQRAKDLASEVERGIDPRQRERDEWEAEDRARAEKEAAARAAANLSFEIVADRWLADYAIGRRVRSHAQARSVVERHLKPAWRGKPLPTITRADVQAVLDGIAPEQQATRRTVYAYAAILFGWAVSRGEIAESPLQLIAKPKAPKARDRVLAPEELKAIWQASEKLGGALGTFYRILMLTGQRREEVAGMDWSELDRATATWIIPAAKAKNGVAHIVPLAPAVIAELDRLSLEHQERDEEQEPDAERWPKAGPAITIRGGVAISGFSQARAKLDAKVSEVLKDSAPLRPWRVHDLRRTLATGFQQLGVRFEVTEAVLNHVSGARGGVAGIYQRHDWKAEKREALDRWALHIAGLLRSSAENDKIVPIRAAKGTKA